MNENEYNLIVISDLHLSEGRSQETKRYSQNEDFFFDESFSRFLRYLDKEGKTHQKKWKLIIAGDMIDFLQVTSLPEPGEVDFDISEREKRFGLGTEAVKTVWKLKRTMDGHWRFFQGLANFLNKGHRVIIIPGNHDIEFVYGEVQNTFKKEIPKYLTDPLEARSLEGNLEFLPWFYYEPELIFVEHGHQYDPLNSFDFFLCPIRTYNRKTTINLPSGSFFVRYFFNMIEKIDPFADNIKPMTRYICWAMRHRFFNPIFRRVLWNYGKLFLEILKKRKLLNDQENEQLSQKQKDLLGAEAKRFGLSEDKLNSIKSLWVPSSISNDTFFKVLSKFFSYEKVSPYLGKGKKIREILGVRNIVFGHTHDPDLRGLPSDRDRIGEYANSGTWTIVFSEEERLLREEKEFAYVQILKQPKPKMELLKWKDELRQGERVNLFEV